MARSVHVTEKQLVRERWFAHTDAVPQTDTPPPGNPRRRASTRKTRTERLRADAIRHQAENRAMK